jgi:hypothetical protein
MRYWYETSQGRLTSVVTTVPAKGHDGYGMTPDLADIPGPLRACRWNGTDVVVNPTLLATVKAELRRFIEDKYRLAVSETVLTTPWGDFRVRRDDIDAYQMIAFSAIYALQTSTAFSASLRRADDTNVTVTAGQFMQFMALIGSRMAARLSDRDTKLNQLAAATPEQLKGFEP